MYIKISFKETGYNVFNGFLPEGHTKYLPGQTGELGYITYRYAFYDTKEQYYFNPETCSEWPSMPRKIFVLINGTK